MLPLSGPAITYRTTGLEPSSKKTNPRSLQHATVSNFCLFALISFGITFALLVISLVFSVLVSILYHVNLHY